MNTTTKTHETVMEKIIAQLKQMRKLGLYYFLFIFISLMVIVILNILDLTSAYHKKYPQIESEWMNQKSFNELCEVIVNNAKDYYKGIDREDTNTPYMTSNMRWCYEYGYDGDIFIYDNNHHLEKEKLKIVADEILKAFYKSDDFNFIESVFVNGLGNIRVAIKNEYVIPTSDVNFERLQNTVFIDAVVKKYGHFDLLTFEEESSKEFKELQDILKGKGKVISIYPYTEKTIVKEQLHINIDNEKEVRKYCGPKIKVKGNGDFNYLIRE